MISSIKGTVLSTDERTINVDLGSIAVSLFVPHASNYILESTVALHTHLYWHSENGFQLFGFKELIEKELFLIILDCSGIGPKLALAILNQLTPTTIIKAVQTADQKTLASVSGLGQKKAEHLIVQLRHKIEKFVEKQAGNLTDPAIEHWQTLSQVLESLQYGKSEIATTLHHLKTSNDSSEPFDYILRKALNFLSKQ